MPLDLPTLVVVTVFVTALCGGLLLFSWWQNKRVGALAWWGSAFLLGAVGTLLLVLRGAIANGWSIGLGNALVILTYAMLWGGLRVFRGRKPHLALVAAGPLFWLGACAIPAFAGSFGSRVVLASLLTAGYQLLAAAELRVGPGRLGSQMPIRAVFLLHAAIILSRYPTMLATGQLDERTLHTVGWVGLHAFEGLIVIVSSAFLLLCLTKERIEAEQRSIAALDPLTGVLNRRAFGERGRALLARAGRDGMPAAMLVFDIDHFKSVNDRFGHGCGDDVLRSVCRTVERLLPADGAVLARLGGEEFACVVVAGPDEAFRLAERIRAEVEFTPFSNEGEVFGVTVSVGVATSDAFGHVLERMSTAADALLYAAKRGGRNRVGEILRESHRPVAAAEARLAA